jgi:3-dehydrosphinganine reductase
VQSGSAAFTPQSGISRSGKRKLAVVSGGSSGIGLACAHLLARRGYDLVLLARDVGRLDAVKAELADVTGVETVSINVADPAACQSVINAIRLRRARIDWLITCAGIVEPGMFDDLDLGSHRRQMETNYFGTLNLVRPVVSLMRNQGGGRITLVSSAAAFVGIAGYSAYAPSKFAVRALGEVLRVELAPGGIQVGVAFPPDTETPQLAQEKLTRPAVTRRIASGGGVWAADRVAADLLKQAERGRFLIVPSLPLLAFGLLHGLYAPIFRARQRRILGRSRVDDET